MEQKIQQLDAPANYPSPQHATNGFSHGPSAAQVAAYCVIAASIAVYFSCTYALNSSTVLLCLYCLFGAVMIVAAARATWANPTDRLVYSYKWSLQEKRGAFVVDYDGVLFCLHCDSYCLATSKHCRMCNRCVSNFDHHCMWFNNCIGDRNYPSFFVSLLATLAYGLTIIVHTAIATFQVDFSDPAQLLKIVFSWVISATLAVFAFLLGNLIILHIYLWFTNQTTYQFLQRKKQEEAEAIKAKESEEAKQTASIAQLVPERSKDKQVDIHSEDSYANTKAITVHPTAKATEETPQKQQRNFNEAFEQLERRTKVQDGEDLAKNVSERAEDLICVGMDSHEHLPQFLRKNKSLNILLSQSDALSPSKQKAEGIGSLEQIKG